MRQRTCAVLVMLLVVSGLLLLVGCASQEGGGNIPDDPELVQRQIRDLDSDIANIEEMLKGALAERQIEDSMELRDQIQALEMEMYQLKSRRAALIERYRDLTEQESP
jgi:outer membrane murein-binding lipoprotein Lpp